MTRRVNIGVFNILKSLVDNKRPALQSAVDNGHRAISKIDNCHRNISNLQRFIDNNRYDRADTIEAQSEIADMEHEISVLQPVANKLASAQRELNAAENFDKTYNRVVKDACLVELRRQYDKLDEYSEILSDTMFAAQANMNPSERDANTYEQAIADTERYRQEYEDTIQRMQEIAAQIKQYSR